MPGRPKPSSLTKKEALAWKKRWALVNARQIEEMRRTPVATKLQQLAVLMASGAAFDWAEDRAREEAEVRLLWQKLRKSHEKKK